MSSLMLQPSAAATPLRVYAHGSMAAAAALCKPGAGQAWRRLKAVPNAAS